MQTHRSHRRHSKRVLGHGARAAAHAASHPASFLNSPSKGSDPQFVAASREAARIGGYVARSPGKPWKVYRFGG